jgi:cold shock CspA family protein
MIAYVDENGVIRDEPIDPTTKTEIKLEDIEISVPKGSDEEIDPIRKGTITFFNDSKGFGFIKDLETKQDVFVHANNVIGEIKEGNLVTYEVEMGQRGPNAVRVQISK